MASRNVNTAEIAIAASRPNPDRAAIIAATSGPMPPDVGAILAMAVAPRYDAQRAADHLGHVARSRTDTVNNGSNDGLPNSSEQCGDGDCSNRDDSDHEQ